MIRKFFDVSSGHLSIDTWAWLDAQLADEILRELTNTVAAGIAGGLHPIRLVRLRLR